MDIRDVVLLTYDSQTNTGRMHILNISQEGKNHKTLESARDAMQKRLGGFEGEMKTDTVFLCVREEKPIDPMSFYFNTNLSQRNENDYVMILKDLEEIKIQLLNSNRTFWEQAGVSKINQNQYETEI